MDRIYIEMSWRNSQEANRHLDHVTRKKSEIKDPKVEKLGDTPDEYFLELPGRITKPITNRYFEIMTYIRTKTEAERIKDYLECWYKRKVNVYLHDDEGGLHGHFILRNAGDDGRALNLKINNFRDIKKDIAFALDRQLSPKGTGRRRLNLKEIKADPQALQAAKDEFNTTIGYIDELMKLYDDCQSIRIAYRSKKETRERIVQDIDPRRSVRDQLRYRHLMALNMDGAEILFAPVMEPTTKARVIYLDRVPERRLEELPAGSIVVQISEHAYEAHVPISLPLSVSWVAKGQRVLCGVYGANRASVAPDQYRRLPGFRHVSGENPQETLIRRDIICRGRALSISALQADLDLQCRTQEKAGNLASHIRSDLAWLSFFDANRDEADLAYAAYLAKQGYDAAEIHNALLAESEDVVIRKGVDLHPYLDRIVKKAEEHLESDLRSA